MACQDARVSHDEAEHVLLGSSPEVVTSQRTQSKHSEDSCIACWTEGGSGNERFVSCQVRDLGAATAWMLVSLWYL